VNGEKRSFIPQIGRTNVDKGAITMFILFVGLTHVSHAAFTSWFPQAQANAAIIDPFCGGLVAGRGFRIGLCPGHSHGHSSPSIRIAAVNLEGGSL